MSASTARDEDAASVNSNTAVLERISDNELERNATKVEKIKQKDVALFNNSNVTSGSDESPVSENQLQSMLAAFMTAMQAENTKLASNLESKLNKIT